LLPAAGAVPLLVLCVQEPELSLKRVAASALSDIAKHTPELAQVLVDAGAVSYLAPLLVNQDAKLKRQVRPGVYDAAAAHQQHLPSYSGMLQQLCMC
jgi:hypothetical protein